MLWRKDPLYLLNLYFNIVVSNCNQLCIICTNNVIQWWGRGVMDHYTRTSHSFKKVIFLIQKIHIKLS